MKKISIKREQSQAGLSFAEREKFRPQVKNKLLRLRVLLAAVATGAWAQDPAKYKITVAEGTEDAENWTVPAEAAAGSPVTATYNGAKKVKSVKAVKKGGAEPASLIVTPVVGQIIGSDGKNYDANATLPDGVTALAKIAYVGSETGDDTYKNGLALALEDVSDSKTWCNQLSATCLGTQYDSDTKFNDLAGIANTDALVNHTGHTHAAANAARGYNSGTHPTGTSAWFLPSAGQWNKMIGAAGLNNLGLRERAYYWSSTECRAGNAWDFYSNDFDWLIDRKIVAGRVRACLAF